MSFADPVDILRLWPADQRALLDSKKWSERRDSLASLLELAEKYNGLLSTDVNYSDLCKSLKSIIQNDSNINVVALAVKIIGSLANSLNTCFEPYVGLLAPALFEKFKEKKETLKKPLVECADSVSMACTNIDKLLPAMLDIWQQKPNPNVKTQLNWLIYRILFRLNLENQPPPMSFLKALLPNIVKHTEEGDPEVRDSAFAALGSVQRLIGESGLKSLAAAVMQDPIRSRKVSSYFESATKEAEEYRKLLGDANGIAVGISNEQANGLQSIDNNEGQNTCVNTALDPWELYEPVNIIEKLPTSFDEQLASKKWTDRKEALEVMLKLFEAHPRLVADSSLYKEIINQLVKILEKDANINVCALAAKCIKCFADGLRFDFAMFSSSVVAACVEKLKEKKAVMQEPVCACLDTVSLTANLCEYVEKIVTALGKPNPTVKHQTALFLSRLFNMHNSKTCPASAVKDLSTPLTKLASDADPEVRSATFSAIASIMRCIGPPATDNLFTGVLEDVMKKNKIMEEYQKRLNELGDKAAPQLIKIHGNTAPANSRSQSAKSAIKATPTVKRTPSGSNRSNAPIGRPGPSATARAPNGTVGNKPKTASVSAFSRGPSARPLSSLTTSKPNVHLGSSVGLRPTSATQQSRVQSSAPKSASIIRSSPVPSIANNIPKSSTVNVVRKSLEPEEKPKMIIVNKSTSKPNAVSNFSNKASTTQRNSQPPSASSTGSKISRPPSSSSLANAQQQKFIASRSSSSIGSRIPRLGSRPPTPTNRQS